MMKKISVVTGVYNEAEIVQDVYAEIKKVFSGLKDYDYEYIFIDNCSTDATASILKEMALQDKRVKVLVCSRNFGPLKAEMMAYRYVSGDAVVCYEANLKDPPALIPEFIRQWENGFDVVYGIRIKTRDNPLMFIMRKAFYRIVRALSDGEMPVDSGSFRLVSRRVVNELIKLDDYKPYVRGLIASIGFKQVGIEYARRARPKGRSKSSIGYLIDFAINAIVSSSVAPIRLCIYIGLGMGFLSFIALFILLALRFAVVHIQISVLADVVMLIFMLSGIHLFFLGMIGEYVCATHSQVRKKPFVIIKEKINFDN